MTIDSLDDVRPGDIMISGQSTAPNQLIVYGGQLLIGEQFRIGPFAAGHAGVVTPKHKLVEAMPSGARERELRDSDWSERHIYFRLPEDYANQHIDAALIARAMIGTPYSLMSYAYLAAVRFGIRSEWLYRRIDRRKWTDVMDFQNHQRASLRIPVEAICSVLAEQAWTLTGKKVVHGTRPQVVTPGMLTKQLWVNRAVDRGGFGLQ